MIKEIAYKNKEEWLKLRKQLGIGGSDAGAIIGFNPHKSAYTLWAEKTGKLPEFEGNLTTDVGSYLEEFVAKLFEKETGKKVRKKNRILTNTDYPWAFGDIDRFIVGEKALLEIKTTNSIPTMRKIRGGDFPEQWLCQVMHYLAVTGLTKAYLAVLIECRDFKIFELDRDEAEIDALMKAEKEFWELIQTNTAPAADCLKSTSETLTALYPYSNEDTVNLLCYQNDMSEYFAIQDQIKELDKRKEEISNKIKAFMGESGRGESDCYRVSWTTSTRSSFDSKAFANDYKDIDLSKYYKSSTTRTFRITEKKGEKNQ